VSVYISSNTAFERIFRLKSNDVHCTAYSPKLKLMFEMLEKYNNHDLPMLVGGDGIYRKIMRTELGLQLSNVVVTKKRPRAIRLVLTPYFIDTSSSLKHMSTFRISVHTVLYYQH
jgi:hypothetical protein